MTPLRPFPRDDPKRETTWRRGKVRTRQAAIIGDGRTEGYSYILDFPDLGTEMAFSRNRWEVNSTVSARWRNESAVWWIDGGGGIADVYFLCDNTGSMGPTIAAMQTAALDVLQGISESFDNPRVGVGHYRDFSDGPTEVFVHQLDPTNDYFAAQGAILDWTAGGGGDIPESAFYSFHRLAAHADVAFTPGAGKLVVWLGDSPAHDPACIAISGDAHDVTEASVTAELVAGRFAVIGSSANSGPGLDSDPVPISSDYIAFCGPEQGVAGQATRIAAATGGTYLPSVDPASILAALLEAFEVVAAG